uniref:MHD domain-containing protein n=1 Tax=Lactuca sativa TaxID=4236 RepID=A0A9R1XRD4_LACSA|nr:hypothetical protein LSAT_V11C300123940 [Lactuca sativa]
MENDNNNFCFFSLDFGYPQFTEAKILSEFRKTDVYRMEVSQRPPMVVTNVVSWRSEGIHYKRMRHLYFDTFGMLGMAFGTGSVVAHITMDSIMVPRIIQYETVGILDVVESMYMLVNSNGEIVRSEVVGVLKMRTYLSVSLDRMIEYYWRHKDEVQREKPLTWITLSSTSYGQIWCRCVLSAHFENDRTISFVPPDGAFDLMTY